MPFLRIAALLAVACLAAGCASLPAGTQRDARDPFESFNRAMYHANRAVDRAILAPVARGYVSVVPAPLRHGVSRFYLNLGMPRTLINDVLQGKLSAAGTDTGRLVVNTVLGLGFFDPATSLGLAANEEDFGQTLGRWGSGPGPYLMLPVLGPSTLRDALGRVPDEYSSPRHYIRDRTTKYGVLALDAIDKRAGLVEAEALLQQSQDEYSFVRNAWLQRRNYLVHDGDIPDESVELLEPPPDAAQP
jgi:phospholipid-binding lipoprotein MlaA